MNILEWFLNLLYPPKCVFCRKLLKESECGICFRCIEKLPYTNRAYSHQYFENVDDCYSPLFYEGTVKESLRRYKFSSLTSYSEVYANLIASVLISSCEVPDADLITYVPLSRQRYRNRGYNQAQLLAEDLSLKFGIPCVSVLKKIRNVKPQSLTGNRQNRRKNIKDAYIPVNSQLIQGKKIIIVDDIVTTGATLAECAGVLKRSGSVLVSAITVARSVK